jgi:hypothetical protein
MLNPIYSDGIGINFLAYIILGRCLYTMGKILQGSNLTITQWARSPRGAI